MADYPNFYENIKEASFRLRGTVVMYDEDPMYLFLVADHWPDEIFRVYMAPIGEKIVLPNIDALIGDEGFKAAGKYMDEWMAGSPDTPVVRKMMNSPKFRKFRPFPMGMCNHGTECSYLVRRPSRTKEQGLTRQMVSESKITLQITPSVTKKKGFGGISSSKSPYPVGLRSPSVDILSKEFRECVLGVYPDAQRCVAELNDPDVLNEAAAFNREFAFVRGPVGMMFLAYRTDIVGVLPNNDLSCIRLDPNFRHVAEKIEELQIFTTIHK